ncbi:MAG: IS66 family transposase [Bacteroidales bacterium]|nr:IS66 family transposase [Bacteroidales bacterium]
MSETPSKEQFLIQELMRKLDDERAINARLKSELSEYKDPARMKKELESRIKEQDAIIRKQDKTIDKLNQELEWLRRKVWGQSSESHKAEDPNQLTFDFGELKLSPEEEAAYKRAEEEAEALRKQRKTASDKRQAKQKPVRKPLPEHLRREIVEIFPVGYNPEEWELLPKTYDEVTEVLSRKPAEYYVIRYVRHKAVRKNQIDRPIETAPVPQLPIAKSYASAELLADLMVGKYADHMPFYRQIEKLKRDGISLPPPTVNDWFLDVADLLRPLYYRIKDLVLESDYIQSDETTVPIINNEKHKTVKGYLWQVRAVVPGLLFFHYDHGSRGKDVALGLFAHFSGAMQTDGYAVYDIYEKKDGVLSLVCWAHARRYFERALTNDKARAELALEKIRLLYEVERDADDKQMSYEERRQLRMDISLPILMGFEAWLQAEAPKVLPKSPIGKAIHFALERYDRLCRYVVDGRYRIDNNLVENGQRGVAVGRKNYLFCGNDDAAEDAAVIYTMMGCCKAAGVNVYDWLVYFLSHVHEYDNDYTRDLDELLPGNLRAKGLVKPVGESPASL